MRIPSERMSHEEHCDYYRHRRSADKYECSCQVAEVRSLEAVVEAAGRAMKNRNETNSEAYFVEVENRIADLEDGK